MGNEVALIMSVGAWRKKMSTQQPRENRKATELGDPLAVSMEMHIGISLCICIKRRTGTTLSIVYTNRPLTDSTDCALDPLELIEKLVIVVQLYDIFQAINF